MNVVPTSSIFNISRLTRPSVFVKCPANLGQQGLRHSARNLPLNDTIKLLSVGSTPPPPGPNGASDEEIKETLAMASVVRHGSTVLNGMQVDLSEFKRETDTVLRAAADRTKSAASKSQ